MNDIIHAAVRRDLARMTAALQAFPDGDQARADALQRAWQTLWNQLHHHHESEDAYVFPYLRSLGPDALDPALLDAMDSEHEAMSSSIQAAGASIDALAAEPTAARAAAAHDAVVTATEVTDRHLDHEETDVVPAINARMETPEWRAVEKQLRKGPLSQAGEMFAWLEDGMEPRVQQALDATVPKPVRFVLSRVAGRSYHREVAPTWR